MNRLTIQEINALARTTDVNMETRSTAACQAVIALRRAQVFDVEPSQVIKVDLRLSRITAQHGPCFRVYRFEPKVTEQLAEALIEFYRDTGNLTAAEHTKNQLAFLMSKPVSPPMEMASNRGVAQMSDTPSEKPSALDEALTYGSEVAYWTAAIQLTKRGRGLLADVLTQHLKGKSRATKRQMVLDLLEGPAGGPIVALLLSGLLPHGAALIGQKGAKVEHMSAILRLHAGVTVASDVADKLFEWAMPAKDAITQAFAGLPDAPALSDTKRGEVHDLDAERARVAAQR